jgi:hypothetical protein
MIRIIGMFAMLARMRMARFAPPMAEQPLRQTQFIDIPLKRVTLPRRLNRSAGNEGWQGLPDAVQPG